MKLKQTKEQRHNIVVSHLTRWWIPVSFGYLKSWEVLRSNSTIVITVFCLLLWTYPHIKMVHGGNAKFKHCFFCAFFRLGGGVIFYRTLIIHRLLLLLWNYFLQLKSDPHKTALWSISLKQSMLKHNLFYQFLLKKNSPVVSADDSTLHFLSSCMHMNQHSNHLPCANCGCLPHVIWWGSSGIVYLQTLH